MIGEIRISREALRRNAETLRTLVQPVRAAFVVKSNAYGHGLIETALAIEPYASRLCVYALEEAIELRDGGVTAPIVILGPIPPQSLSDALAAKAEIALWDVGSYVKAIVSAARERHTRFPVHVKINTGVNRFGLEAHDAADAVEEYLRHPEIEIAGVFSHLAAAEELDSPFTNEQLDRFNRAYAQMQPQFEQRKSNPIRHIAASAAAMLWPQTRLDMVRFGIALYGLWPSPQTREAMHGPSAGNGNSTGDEVYLEPALSYVSLLAAVRDVPAGASVGYGCTYNAPQAMRIGAVPLGYADGIPRLLSNTGTFTVDGALCPIIGRVCMNVTLLDLTAAPNARAGSPVTLIGNDGNVSVTVDDWATWAQTINYEIVTRLPSELTRVYT